MCISTQTETQPSDDSAAPLLASLMTDGFCEPAGYSVFVVGVADVDMTELRIIGSKPSERHVFVVDDYDAFAKIQDNLITFICETATSSKADCPFNHPAIKPLK